MKALDQHIDTIREKIRQINRIRRLIHRREHELRAYPEARQALADGIHRIRHEIAHEIELFNEEHGIT